MAINIQLSSHQKQFWDDFLKEIEVSNSKKSMDAPKALFLAAEYGFENVRNDPPTHFFILNIAKTHLVAIWAIEKINQIKPTIESAIQLEGKPQPIDLLVFNAHGNNTFMNLSKNEEYSFNDIKDTDFEGLSPNAKILLASCEAANGLAQKIADVTRHIVFAPIDNITFARTSFVFCEKHKLYEMRSYSKERQPKTYRFQKDKPPVLCDEPSTYFSDLHAFLTKKCQQGDQYAQFDLGVIEYEAGNTAAAKILYEQAASQGNLNAQLNLGGIEEDAGDIPKAIKWYLNAALQGNLNAQFNLGCLKEETGDIDAAKMWYRKAADQGDSEALTRLQLLEKSSKKKRKLRQMSQEEKVDTH